MKNAAPSLVGTQKTPAPWETAWKFLIKLNINLPCDPAIPLLDIYPREERTYVHTKSCSRMFIVALFIISKRWKQPKCPSAGEQINNGILLRNEMELMRPQHEEPKRIMLSEGRVKRLHLV